MFSVKCGVPEPEISLDRNKKPRGRRGKLDLDAKEALLRLYAAGEETAAIADRFGIDETNVRKLASRYGVRKGARMTRSEAQPHRPTIGGHLPAYKRARRGFDLPERLEPRYIRLLVSGQTCLDAARILGVTGDGDARR